MIKFINIGLEDESLEQNEVNEENDSNEETTNQEPDAVDKAIEVVDNEDSNDAGVILKVANYKEELAKLQGTSEDTSDETMESENDSNNEEENLEEDTSDEDNNETEKDSANQEQTTEEVEQEIKDNDAKAESQNKQIEENTEKLNESMEAYSLMLDLKDKALQANRRNMLTANSVKLLTATTDHIKQKLKISDYRGHILPAVESFYSVSTRQKKGTTLVAAMESIISEIFEGILKFIEKIIGFIFGFFTTTSKSVSSAREKNNNSNKIQSEAEKIAKTGRVNRDINNPKDHYPSNPLKFRLVDYTSMNGIITGKHILQQGNNFVNICEDIFKTYFNRLNLLDQKIVNPAKVIDNELAELMTKLGDDNSEENKKIFIDKVTQANERFEKIFLELSKKDFYICNSINIPANGLNLDKLTNGDIDAKVTNELPGGFRFYIKYPNKETTDVNVINKSEFNFHKEGKTPEVVNILLLDNLNDGREILKLKEKIIKLLENISSSKTSLVKIMRNIEADIKKFNKENPDVENSEDKHIFITASKRTLDTKKLTLHYVTKIMLQVLSKIIHRLTNYNDALMSYHTESCKAFMKQS